MHARGYITEDGMFGVWSPSYGQGYATNTATVISYPSPWYIEAPPSVPSTPYQLMVLRELQAATRCLPGLLPPWPRPRRLVSRMPVRPRLSCRGRAAGSPSWARRK